MVQIKNLLINLIKKGNFKIFLNKILKRLENNNSELALKWAKQHNTYSTEDICRIIDHNLFEKIQLDLKNIENAAKKKLTKLNLALGGAGNYVLIYFLIRKFKPNFIVETGIALGWSSFASLRALEKNKKGFLYSSDFPYLRLKNPEKYIGFLITEKNLKKRWHTDIRGDAIALPKIKKLLKKNKIDLFHYDSDKSVSGRNFALKTLEKKFSKKCIIIFDDIQNNLHFKNYVEQTNKNFKVIKFQNKFLGVVGI
jgi:predicted O-methyltransferase YrrM